MALEFFSSSVADAEVTFNPSKSTKRDIATHFNDVISKAGLSSSIEKLNGGSGTDSNDPVYGSNTTKITVTNLMGYTGDISSIYPYCNISKTITAQIVKDDDRKIFILMPKDYYNGENIMVDGDSFGSQTGDYWISAFFYLIIINGTYIGSARQNKNTSSPRGDMVYNSAGSFFNSTAFTTKTPLISNKSNVIAPVYPNTAHGSFNVPSNSKGFVPYLYFTLSGHWLPSQVKVTDGKQTFTSIGNGMYIIDSSQEQTLSNLNPREIEVVS